ncbi:hypothetical protein HN789_06695 [archaeon]|jgi:hypothetical protein|nr:hypothetical protein [archaeon]MBT4022747.1 hypothetical protein [archaeon]MBT4273059.1 hypothetical protein [archaeon]MBT4461040.1 hypothetical protein [archaeon]MBT4858066.1 hypothetical protein [archaeon]
MKKSRRAKKEKRNKAFIVIVLILFLVSSIGGVVVYYGADDQSSFTVNVEGTRYRFKVTSDQNGNAYYSVKSKDSEFTTFYPPQNLLLNIEENMQDSLINSPYFYLSIDPESENMDLLDYLRWDIRQNLPISKFFIEGMTSEYEGYTLPIVNCQNATTTIPVVILKNTNVTNITSSNNCLEMNFAPHQAMQARDMLIYLMQGIKPGVDYGN